MIQLLLGRNRLSTLICLAAMFFFVLMTGGSPSVIRAAVMESFMLVAPLFRREADPITNMSFALMLLLIKNPAAIASASLQLSFAAIAGIELISGRVYNYFLPNERRRKFRRLRFRFFYRIICFFVSSISSSAGALFLSTPFVLMNFGYMNLYSLLTNLLCLWCSSLLFCGGFAAVALYVICAPLGTYAALALSFPARYIFAVVKIIASLPYSTLYLGDGTIAAWLAASYVIIAICYFFRGDEKFRPAYPLCLSVIILCSVLMTQGLYDVAAVLDVGQGSCTVITSGDTAAVIDCGGTYGVTAARQCAAMLFNQGQRDIDLLALTHLHSDHTNGVAELFSLVTIKAIALPADTDDSDGMLDTILECAQAHGTEVYYISEGSTFTAGDIQIEARVLGAGSDENETGAIYHVAVGEFDALITGDVGIETEYLIMQNFEIDSLELLVAGHHGSSGSSGGIMLSQLMPQYAVVSVGKGNSYGHPTDEALSRLVTYCEAVYRTDEAGSIVFRLG
jgi:competence protein ComEC